MTKRADAVRREQVVFPRAPALNRLRSREREADELFVAQPAKRRVDRANDDLAACPPLDFLPNPNAVRVVAEMDDREHDVQLELTDEVALGHYYDKRVVRRPDDGAGWRCASTLRSRVSHPVSVSPSSSDHADISTARMLRKCQTSSGPMAASGLAIR